MDPLGPGRWTHGPRQLLQDQPPTSTEWREAASPSWRPSSRSTEDQRGRGPAHRQCVGVQRALHELLVQEPEAGALLPVSSGASPLCAPQLLTMR